MSGGISSHFNSAGNIYTTGWRGAGSASGAGSAGGVGSGGSAGSFGNTVMGSAVGSFGNMLDDITANLAWDNISWNDVGLFSIDEKGVCGGTPDGPFYSHDYEPDGSSNQGTVDAPFTDKGWWENILEEYR